MHQIKYPPEMLVLFDVLQSAEVWLEELLPVEALHHHSTVLCSNQLSDVGR